MRLIPLLSTLLLFAQCAALPVAPFGPQPAPLSPQQQSALRVVVERPACHTLGIVQSGPERGSQNQFYSLTFDDGPFLPYTHRILDLLKQFDAKATFFVVGIQVEAHPEVVERILAEGHEIANHSWNHKDDREKSAEELREELRRVNEEIRKRTPEARIAFYRPPFGYLHPLIEELAAAEEMAVTLWSLNSGDTFRSDNTMLPYQTIRRRLKPSSIVLLHDLGGQRSLREMLHNLRLILEHAERQQLRSVTLSDLLECR